MLNTYQMVTEVRQDVGDYSDDLVKGVDTSGAFTNSDIMKKINDAQLFLYNQLLNRDPHFFDKVASLTGVASVYTLPYDWQRTRRIEDANGVQLHKKDHLGSTINPQTGWVGGYQYWYTGNTFVTDKNNSSDVLTLTYVRKVRELNYGLAPTGAAQAITLATTARKTAGYYVGMTIADLTADWEDIITAYSSARVATITQTAVNNDYYGLVSELPEDLHHLIPKKATLMMKESHKSPKSPSASELLGFEKLMSAAFIGLLGGTDGESPIRETFL